ncbi:MAG: hypothetical protein WAT93_04435 [Pontixanthobacter sp.]
MASKVLASLALAPTVKFALTRPFTSASAISGVSLSSFASLVTSRKLPSAAPRCATVMAIRTAAASLVALVQG